MKWVANEPIKALKGIDMNPQETLTSGIGFDLASGTLTSGQLMSLASAATLMTSAGRLFLSDHTGNASVSGVLNELRSAAADETVVCQIKASAALALGMLLNLSGLAMTTGIALNMSDLDALTTGGAIKVLSNSSSSGTRSLVSVKNDNALASGTTCLDIIQDSAAAAPIKTTNAATSTNFFKVGTFNGVTLWVGNGNTGNSALTGTAGDILFNGGSNKPEFCGGTTTWTALV